MTSLKQSFGIIISFFVFWFSMIGIQRIAEFSDIEPLKFIKDSTKAASAFYSPYPFLIVFLITLFSLYFFVQKPGKLKQKEKFMTGEEKNGDSKIKE
ncbi:DUF3935 domain-containing protein [Bacillus cereus]